MMSLPAIWRSSATSSGDELKMRRVCIVFGPGVTYEETAELGKPKTVEGPPTRASPGLDRFNAVDAVKLLRDRVAFDLSEIRHTATFRQILPEQSIGILVISPLPRVVAVGDVELDAGLFLQITVSVKLATVVGSDLQELAQNTAPSVSGAVHS
jgi:hypothetical protein